MNVFIINSADTYEHRVDLLYSYFKKQGNHVTVLASDFRHIAKERRMELKEGYKFFTAEPYYRNLSMQRIMSYKHLSEDIFRYVGEHIQEVDLLWVLVPPNSFVKDAAKIKKQYPRIQLVLDIIDMWPETLPVGNLKDCYPIKFWGHLRNEYINCADLVVTECALYQEKLKKYVPNSKMHTLYLARDIHEFNSSPNLPKDKIALCYLGSINNIIDIDTIGHVIEVFSKTQPVVLHIIGDGEKKNELIACAKKYGADVIDHGLIYQADDKQDIFNQCHYGLNIYKSSVYIGLTMKSMDYFEAGLPIINNIQGDSYQFVEKYKLGLNLPVKQFTYDPNQRQNARLFFEDFLSSPVFMKSVDKILDQNKKDDLTVSIALAAYNGEKYIEEQIMSITCQLHEEDELIVSYNPSIDHTLEILQKLAKTITQLKIYQCKERGVMSNFENAIKHCQNELIFLSDQDDVWHPDKIERMKRYFQGNQDLGGVVHEAIIVDENLQPVEYGKKELDHTQYLSPKQILYKNYVQGSCLVFRKELVAHILPFPKSIPMHDSWIGMIIAHYSKLLYVKEKLIDYRQHEHNVTSRTHQRIKKMSKDRMTLFYEYEKRIRKTGA